MNRQDPAGSTITPAKRSYSSTRLPSPASTTFPGGDRFLQTFQLSLQQDKLNQEKEERRWARERIERQERLDRERRERQETLERERRERQEARDDMMKMLGIAVSQFANAISSHSSSGNNTSMSAVFRPGQVPRFEDSNGQSINLPPPPRDEDDEEDGNDE